MSILNDIKGLFLPPVCPVCGGELHEGEGAFCMMCRTLAPQTGFWRRADNPLAERLRNEFPVVQASAFLWFVAGSPWQRAIHGFKYYNRWRTARDLGAWYGGNLADSGLYGSVDCIVPVPLHTRRLLARGYNQAAYIRRGDRFPDGSAGGGSGGQSPAQQPEPDDPFFGRALGERTRLVCGRAARSVGRTARAAGR